MNNTDSNSRVFRPPWGWFFLLDGGLALLGSVSFSDRAYGRVARLGRLPRQRVLRRLFVVAVAIHVGEAVGAARSAARRSLPVRVWAMQTLIVGFPSLLALRRASDGQVT
jgi:Domain of unknown function (DUF4499)